MTGLKLRPREECAFDHVLNYRPSLWKSYGGQRRAQEVNRALAEQVDVMIGNEEDFTACLGFEVPNTGEDLTGLETGNFKAMISQVTAEFGFSVVATTLRGVISATVNDWGAIAWSAHGALAMTTPGDTSMASVAEVRALVAGAGARVQRLSRNGARP